MRAARACKEATTLAPQPIHKVLSGLRALAFRLGGDRRGNVAIIFALSLPVIVMLALGGVDIHRITTAKAQFQDALDAAALAAARSPYTTPEELKSITLVNLRANLKGIELEPVQDGDVQVAMNDKSVVIATAQGRVKTLVANIVLPPYGQLLDDTLPVSVRSEVNRSSRDVEVALVLDITGSMNDCAASCSSGRKIDNLKSAAKELIDIVVQDNQSPFYSKVALAPYSMGVNVGDTYADRARGALASSTQSITAAIWLTGSVKTITSITRAYTPVVTASKHGFKNGDIVTIWSAETMGGLNGIALTVGNATTNTFSLVDRDTRYYSAFSGRAYVAKCARADCNIVITMARHGLSPDGDAAVLSGMGGLSQLNDIGFRVAGVSATTATLALDASQAQLANAPRGGAAYTSGGQLVCGVDGCSNRDFVNAAGTWTRFPGTTCVSERAGAQAYTQRLFLRPSLSALSKHEGRRRHRLYGRLRYRRGTEYDRSDRFRRRADGAVRHQPRPGFPGVQPHRPFRRLPRHRTGHHPTAHLPLGTTRLRAGGFRADVRSDSPLPEWSCRHSDRDCPA